MEEFEKWLKTVHDGHVEYDSKVLLEYLDSFADPLVEHMNHVSCNLNVTKFAKEPNVLDRNKLRETFTEKQLKDIDAEFLKLGLANIDYHTTLPITLVCGNPATPWCVLFYCFGTSDSLNDSGFRLCLCR